MSVSLKARYLAIRASTLGSSVASLSILQLFNYLFPLATVPFLIRKLGLEAFGVMSVSLGIAQVLILLTDYGFNLSATRKISKFRNSCEQRENVLTATAVAKLLLVMVSLLLIVALSYTTNLGYYDGENTLLPAGAAVLGAGLLPVWYFQGLELMRPLVISQILGRFTCLVGIFVWVGSSEDIVLATFLQSAPLPIAGVIGVVYLRRAGMYQLRRPTIGSLRSAFVDGWHCFLSTASVVLYTSVNVVLLGAVAGPVAAGAFAAVEKIVRAATSLITPVAQAVYPRVSLLMGHNAQEANQLAKKATKALVSIGFAASITMFAFSRPISLLLGGRDFVEGPVLLMILSPIPILVAINTGLGTLLMLTNGLDRSMSKILLTCGVLNVVGVIMLSFVAQERGAAAAVCVTEALVAVGLLCKLIRSNILPSPFRIRKLHS